MKVNMNHKREKKIVTRVQLLLLDHGAPEISKVLGACLFI